MIAVMSADAPVPDDYYAAWLGLPPGPRPPDHYTLLGLAPFEPDPELIRAAARQRSEAVRPLCTRYPVDATRLLNEIADAAACLLDPEMQAAYNRLLLDEDQAA